MVDPIVVKVTDEGLDPVLKRLEEMGIRLKLVEDAAKRSGISVKEMAQRYVDASDAAKKNNVALDDHVKKTEGGSRAMTAFRASLSGVQAQLVALAAGSGPVGTFLAGLGPWGFAAAVGLGALVAVLEHMNNEARRMGREAQGMSTFAATTGLTVNQIQALSLAAQQSNITQTQLTTSMEQFSQRVDEARKLTGDLYQQLRLIDPQYAREMATTKDLAGALDVLTRARQNAATQEQSNRLMRSATGGRGGGAQFGLVLDELGNLGGMDAAIKKARELGVATEAQTEKWSAQLTKIETLKKNTADLMALTYTGDTLDRMERAEQRQNNITRALLQANEERAKEVQLVEDAAEAAARRTRRSVGGPRGRDIPPMSGSIELDPIASFEKTKEVIEKVKISARALSNEYNQLIAAFGGAATAEDLRTQKLKQAAAALDEKTLNEQQHARVVGSINLDNVIQLESQRLGILGQSATVQEIYNQKINEGNKARAFGVNITKEEIATAASRAAVQHSGGRLSSGMQLFDPGEAAILKQRIDEVNQFLRENPQLADKAGEALANAAKKAREEWEQTSTQFSRMPGLRRMELDASSLGRQLDTLATTNLNNLSNGLTDFATGSKTAQEAIADFEKQLIRSLINMAIQMSIIAPIAKSLQAIMSSFTGGGGGGSFFTPAAVAHGGGIVGKDRFERRYVHPAYFENAPRFHTGMGADEFAAILKRGEGVFTPAQMRAMGGGGSGGAVNVIISNAPAGTSAEVTKRRGPGGLDIQVALKRMVDDRLVEAIGDPNNPVNQRLGAMGLDRTRGV